jgi:hypothetical protein
MPKRIETAAAVLLTLMAAGFHAQRALHAGALWRDEAGAVGLATLPTLVEVFQRFPHEAFPLLFPATVRAWTAVFGGSDAALRVLGMAVGLAILAALWINARAAGTVPLVSVALVGFHPAFLTYGDSIRGYGLGTLLILLTFGAFSRMVARTDRRTVLAAAVPAVLGVHVLLHNSALLLGLGVAAAAVGVVRRRWRLSLAALGVGFLAALSLIPYVRPLAAARDWDVLMVEDLSTGQILGSLAATLGNPSAWVIWLWAAAVAAGVTTAVAALVRKSDPGPEQADVRLFRLLAVPAACAAQYGLFLRLGYLPRVWYFLPLLALVASVLDGLLAVRTGLPRAVRLAAAVLVAGLLAPAQARTAGLRMTNVDRVARYLEESAGPEDLILVNPWFYGVSFHRYYQGEAKWMTVPGIEDHQIHRYDLLKARMASPEPLGDVARAVRRTLRSGRRVWLVGNLETPPDGGPPPVWGPAPKGSPWGWRDAPYTGSWSLQVGALLRQRSVRERRIDLTDLGPVNPFENLSIHEFRGWRSGGRRGISAGELSGKLQP